MEDYKRVVNMWWGVRGGGVMSLRSLYGVQLMECNQGYSNNEVN